MASGGSGTPFVRTEVGRMTSWGEFAGRVGLLSTGKRFYVDSSAGSANNGGLSPDDALATIDAAVNKCTADKGDVILVMPGHNEGASAAIFDANVAGISIIGLTGIDGQRPILDFDHANATIDVGANNVRIAGFRLRPSVTAVLIGVHVETDVTGTVIENCEWMNGEDGSGTDEFVKAVELTSGNHDTVIRDCRIRAHASAAGATHAIHVSAASDRLVFERVRIDGPYATGGIVEDEAGSDHILEDVVVDVTGTNYSFHASSTFASFINNRGSGARVVNTLGQEYYPGLGYKVTKVEDVNTATSDNLFTLTGKVDIRLWTGEVTNALDAAVTDYKIELTTLAGVLIAAGDIASSIVGHMFALNCDAGDTSLSTSTSAVSVAGVADTQGKGGHLVVGKAGGSDIIKATRTAGAAGDAIRHDVFYEPLEAGASMVAAA